MTMQIREGWTFGIGSVLAAAALILGLLIIINVAPDNPTDIGLSIVLLAISRIAP
jgi:hypothetical protein